MYAAAMKNTAPQPGELDADACWARLVDPALPGPDCIVGVVTTGIACRIGCPSRRPKRENVRFFATLADALATGLRPCKRCRPDQAQMAAADRATRAVEKACTLIERALSEGEAPPSLPGLATAVNLSPFHFQRLFKRLTGVSPRDYATGLKQGRLVAALGQGDAVAGALYEAGFGAASQAYRAVKSATGTTPARLKAGVELTYGIVETIFGRTLVAATGQGIAALLMGDEDEPLVGDLARRFPRAVISRDEARLAPILAAVAARAAAPDAGGDLPLDLRGTAFEIAVWNALRDIPVGETRTYGALAAAIGKPGAARAVGRACGANPVSILVPCHRAVGADGSLTGYRWGTQRKRRLLAIEQDATG